MRPLRFGRFGLTENPIGYQVALPYSGRTLLGDVVGCRWRDGPRGGFVLTVRHFNGEPWPIEPSAGAVLVIERGES